MTLLDPLAAQHFSRSFANRGSAPNSSFRGLLSTVTAGVIYAEGAGAYDTFRDAALREVERSLLLAASHYRRSMDLLVPSACPWAHVTMYYGSYFAASALLGMFGAWKAKRHNVVIDVAGGAAGSLAFHGRSVNFTAKGSHQIFWEFFYDEVPALVPWVNPATVFALSPISGNPYWMIETRNDVNYDTFSSINAIHGFQAGFKPSAFPASLPGALNTQFKVFEGLLSIAAAFAKDFKLETDALQAVSTSTKRRQRIRALVFRQKSSSMGNRAKQRTALG